jgi:hypothetical protein
MILTWHGDGVSDGGHRAGVMNKEKRQHLGRP